MLVKQEKAEFHRWRGRADGAIMFPGRCRFMSQYVFHCQDCNKEFTQALHMADVDKGVVTCPQCGGTRVHQLVSAFTAVTSKKS